MKPSVFAIEIEVSDELLTKLTREARERGCTVDELVELALTSEVS
jgi:purine-nucleoside phosphorylase